MSKVPAQIKQESQPRPDGKSITEILASQTHYQVRLGENPAGKPLWGQLGVGINGYVAQLPRGESIVIAESLFQNLQEAASVFPGADGLPRNKDIIVHFEKAMTAEQAEAIRKSKALRVFPQRVIRSGKKEAIS